MSHLPIMYQHLPIIGLHRKYFRTLQLIVCKGESERRRVLVEGVGVLHSELVLEFKESMWTPANE